MLITRLQSRAEIHALIQHHNTVGKPIAIDTETTGLNRFKDKVTSIIIEGYEDESAAIFNPEFMSLLNELTVPVILQNFKFDFTMLYPTVEFKYGFRDTMLMHNLYNENLPHGLDFMVQDWFKDNYKEEFWGKYKKFGDAPLQEQDEYAGKDVIYTKKIYNKLCLELEAIGIPYTLIRYIHDFAYSLWCTELEGVNLDVVQTLIKGFGLKRRLKTLLSSLRDIVPIEIRCLEMQYYVEELIERKTEKGKSGVVRPIFNFGSGAQLRDLIYGLLKLPIQYSEDNKPTLDDNALNVLKDLHPLVAHLREYRELDKIYGSFIEGILEQHHEGKIHPSFNINGTVTGRISCSAPNLQQLPSSGGIRSIIKPREGHRFISCDYGQLEVTLAAHFSLDANLLKVIHEGVSLHDITAQGLGIERSHAKTINFAIQYGAGISKIQSILKCDEKRAEQILQKYWETYPGLKSLMDTCHSHVDNGTPLINPFGRQRRFGITKASKKWEISAAKRQAFNSLIQGTGADITNTAFTLISKELRESQEGRGLFVIHDEILIEVLTQHTKKWDTRLKAVMVQVGKDLNLQVPLTVDSSGPMDCWLD